MFTKLLFIIILTSLFLWRMNILFMLINLELLILSSFISISTSPMSSNFLFILLFFGMMTASSCIGLSLLVSLSRTHLSASSISIFLLSFDKNYSTNIPFDLFKPFH